VTTNLSVDTQGVLKKYILGPSRGSGKGSCQLTPEEFGKLGVLLSALPPSEPLKPSSRFIVSFLDRGEWTTRIYDGIAARTALKALLDFPKFNDGEINFGYEF
jgi:hypothetical protein